TSRPHMRLQWRDVLVTEQDGTGLGAKRAGNAVDQRGLSRTIRADEAKPFPRANFDADIVDRGKAAEALGNRTDPQQGSLGFGQRHASPSLRLPRSLRMRPMMPSGAPTTNRTSTTPRISTFTSEEMVTVSNCCVVLSRIAPIIGPDQCAVPPISDIASVDTE